MLRGEGAMTGNRSGAVMEHLRTLFSVGTVGAASDGHLLDLFITRRDEAAFSALIERHGPMVHRVCWQVLGDRHDAQDASQAVFLVLAKRARSIRSRGSVASWLHTVALHTAAKALTAAARRRAHERRAGEMRARAADDRGPGEGASWQEVHEELDRLPEKFREPIVLCYLEGLTREMAAQQLGWPVGTVQSRLARGQERLRSRLVRRGVTLSAGFAAGTFGADTARAAMTSAWVSATIKAAMRIATGESVVAVATARVASMSTGTLKAMMFYQKHGTAIAILVCGSVAIGAATVARQRITAQTELAETGTVEEGRVQELGLTPAMPLSMATPLPMATSLEDILEAAMKANAGRTTGTTWRPAGGGASDGGKPVPGDVSATGRVRDLQGRGVAGARLWVLAIKRPRGDDLGPFLAALSSPKERDDLWKAWHELPDVPMGDSQSAGGRAVAKEDPTIQPPATSDAEGRLTIEGIGPERAVLALIEGPSIESKLAIFMTRPGPALQAKEVEGLSGLTVHGTPFNHIAAPSRTIEGVVRDVKTGQPLAGVPVRAASSHTFTGIAPCIRTTSDARGHYRLVGVAAGTRDRVVAVPPADQPYFPMSESIEVGRGDGPVQRDLSLKKGVWIRGRVTDSASGKAAVAEVEYHALAANPHLGPNPSHEMRGGWTDSGGSFRLLGLPGPGFVAAKSPDRRHVRRVGFGGVFGDRSGHELVECAYPLFVNASVANSVVGIDPSEDAETISCEVKFSTGSTRRGVVLGPDGTRLSGLVARGLTPGWDGVAPPSTAEFAVTALAPGEQRPLVFRHDARKLIGALTVSGDEAGPLSVTLGPWSSVTGRVVDEDGEPRSDIAIVVHHEPYPEHVLGGSLQQPSFRFELGKDGRFRIDALAPGVKYDLNVLLGGVGIIGYVERGLMVQSGEVMDLGDRKVVDTR